MNLKDKAHVTARNSVTEGVSTWVSPIRSQEKVREIEELLRDKPRDLCLFVFGTNTNLRASDLVRIEVDHVRHLSPGDAFRIIEKKTGKHRRVVLNNKMHQALHKLLPHLKPGSPLLFQSQKGSAPMTVEHAGRLVKAWCHKVGLKGPYCSHSLRKTWAYTQHTVFGVDVPKLMVALNHSSERETLLYIGIEKQEIQDLFMNEV